MVTTRLRAAAMASGEGVWAGAAQTDSSNVPTMNNRRRNIVILPDGDA
jgi:hypothetical protein